MQCLFTITRLDSYIRLALLLMACTSTAQNAPLVERTTPAAARLPLGPLGYSPAHMDRRISPRLDFYGYTTGN